MKNKIVYLTLLVVSASIFVLACAPPAYARRSRAGGADMQEFDSGSFIKDAGKQMLSSAISGAISGSSDIGGNMMGGYNSWVVNRQVGRAVNMMGSYYDWDPKKSFMMQNIIGGAAGGFAGSGASGLATGALNGAISGAVTWSIDSDKIIAGQNPSFGGRLAGSLIGSLITSGPESIKGVIIDAVVDRAILGSNDPSGVPVVDRYVNNVQNGIVQADPSVGNLGIWVPPGRSTIGSGQQF